MNNNKTDSFETAVVRASRVYSVSPETAFNAWADPLLIAQWFGPPGYQAEVLEHDFRVGGRWRFRMSGSSNSAFHHFGQFIEIDRPHRLVFSWASEEQIDGWRDTQGQPTHVAISFNPHAKGVKVDLTHQRLASQAARNALTHGWQGSLDSLASCFATGDL